MYLNIMFFAIMYPITFIMYIVLKAEGKNRSGIYYGCTVTKEQTAAPEIAAITASFNRKMNQILFLSLLVPVSTIFVSHISIQFTIWMMWLLVMLAAFFVPLAWANDKMKSLKEEKGWYLAEDNVTYIETRTLGSISKVHFIDFLFPLLISTSSAGFLIYHMKQERIASFCFLVIVLAVMTFFLFGIAIMMNHTRAEVISSDSETNLNYTRARNEIWRKFFIFAAWINTLYTVAAAVSLWFDTFFFAVLIWGYLLYSILLIAAACLAGKRIRALNASYEEKRDLSDSTNDDRNWLLGMLYYNPKDPHLMVNKRVGIGTTINMARPFGKFIYVFIALLMLSLPVICGWMIMEEFTPIALQITDETLVADHISEEYEIPVSEIEDITLIEELPHWSKTIGTAMDTLEKGTFYIRNVGKVQVFLNPENSKFITFTANGTTYYMSCRSDAETLELYDTIK